jgi:hypothetical protein
MAIRLSTVGALDLSLLYVLFLFFILGNMSGLDQAVSRHPSLQAAKRPADRRTMVSCATNSRKTG